MKVIPPTTHWCTLPECPLVEMTLAQCEECKQWWFWYWDPSGDFWGTPYLTWRQVKWYHFGLKQRIAECDC